MNKFGKHKKCSEKAPAKQPKVKNAILQTYFVSLIGLVLCVTMFFGTSFAWFTSEVNNTGNEIYVGTLKVGLYKDQLVSTTDDEGTITTSTQLENLSSNASKLFDSNIRWEPGYTALETIHVVNEGDLAFDYALNFTDGTLGGNALSLEDVAKYFEVRVYNGKPDAAVYTDYEKIAADSKWSAPVGLEELLSGEAVLEGQMYTVRDNDANTAANAGTTDGVKTIDTYTIALHMKEVADAAVMGQKITMNVKLVAYQKSSETDDFGTSYYDNIVAVNTEEKLAAALNAGGEVLLTGNIELEDALTVADGKTAVLHLNGHEITGNGKPGDALIQNNGTLTIEGNGKIAITFTGVQDNDFAVNAISNRGVLTINGGLISNTGTGSQIGYAIDNYNGATLTVNGGEISASGSSYYDGIRLFCGSNETVVTVNGGEISSIWAQNPTTNKATEVKGAVIINGGTIGNTFYENYTTVKVKDGVTATVTPYGEGKDNTTTGNVDGYTVYSFKH